MNAGDAVSCSERESEENYEEALAAKEIVQRRKIKAARGAEASAESDGDKRTRRSKWGRWYRDTFGSLTLKIEKQRL